MSLIESQVDKKISSLNKNGKVKFLFTLIQHCLQKLPDLEKISINTVKEQIDQLVAMVKYILLLNNQKLSNKNIELSNNIKILQKKNINLKNKLDSQKKELEIEQFDNNNLTELKQLLADIYKLNRELNFSENDWNTITSKFQHLSSIVCEIPDVELTYGECKKNIDRFENQLKQFISKKEKINAIIRGKVDAI